MQDKPHALATPGFAERIDERHDDHDDEWWVRVRHAFTSHLRDERDLVERYEQLIETTTDPGARLLLELIVEDEHRHHALFERLRKATVPGAASAVPGVPHPPSEEVEPLLVATRAFLAFE